MKTIALTGSIASGKSFVASIIEKIGFDIFYCDKFVSNLYTQQDFLNQIMAAFPDIKPLNKENIANYIFNSKEEKTKLERIIHPIVTAAIKDFFENCSSKGANLCFVEIPLLYETNSEYLFNYVIVVTCSDALREERALEREGMTKEKFEKILKTQIHDIKKIELADFVLHTDDNELDLKEEILKIIKIIECA